MTTDIDAKAALASVQAARAGVAGPVDYPLWYDLLYGGVCALLVGGQGLPAPWSSITLPFAMLGLVLMVTSWRRRYGWWINGFSPRRARWIAVGMAGVFVALIALSLYGRSEGPWWLFMVSMVLGFVAAITGSRLWMRAWRAELAEDAQ